MKYLLLIYFISASWSAFFIKSLILDISFSTAVKAVVAAKFVILGILSLTSFDLALRARVVARIVILGIFYTSFLTAFFIDYITYFSKSTEKCFNLSTSNSANLSIFNLSASDCKLAKSSFLSKLWYIYTCFVRFCCIIRQV